MTDRGAVVIREGLIWHEARACMRCGRVHCLPARNCDVCKRLRGAWQARKAAKAQALKARAVWRAEMGVRNAGSR